MAMYAETVAISITILSGKANYSHQATAERCLHCAPLLGLCRPGKLPGRMLLALCFALHCSNVRVMTRRQSLCRQESPLPPVDTWEQFEAISLRSTQCIVMKTQLAKEINYIIYMKKHTHTHFELRTWVFS